MKNVFVWAALALCTAFQAQPLEKSLLWKITGNGISKPSYLFGTIHMSCDATLSDKVKKALTDTNQLYLELDMDDPSLQMNMMQGMMLKDGKTLSSYLSADEKQLVDKFLKENAGAGIDQLNTLKPVLVSMLTLPKLLDCPIKSIEQELMKVTSEQSEQVYGLETVEAQMAALDAVPIEEQVKELIKSIRDGQVKDKEELKNLIAVYNSGDIELMLKLSNESENVTTSKYGADLLDKRNKNWIPVIGSVAKEKPTFFAVGAAHLAGENGVIKLLRKAGFMVEAVR